MAGTISDRLALIIDAQTGGASSAIKELAGSSDVAALSEERRSVASLKAAAADDKAAVSAEKLSLAQAKQTGDTDAAVAAQARLSEAQTKASVSKAEAAAASDKLAAAEARARAEAAGVGQEASTSGGLLDKLGLSGATAAASMETLGLASAAVIAKLELDTLSKGISKFETLAEQVRSVQNVLGGTAREASLLNGQLVQLGIDPEQATKALARMGGALGDGSSKLGTFGIEVVKNKDGTTDLYGTLDKLRAAYTGSADAATKDAIAKQLGLRNAQALIPLLKLTNDQVKALNDQTRASHGLLTQSELEAAHEYTIEINQVKQAWDGVYVELGSKIVPVLGDVLRGILAINTGADYVGTRLGKGYDVVSGALEGLVGASHHAAGAARDHAAAAGQDAAATDAATTSVKNLTSALEGEVSAQNAVYSSVYDVIDAKEKLTKDQAALGDLITSGGVDASKVTSALEQMRSAEDAVTKAQRSEADAQETLNKARERATALELAEARSKEALAGDKITSANAAKQQAQEKLDALLGSGTASAGDIAAAQADLKQKTDDVTQAVLDQQQAHVDLQTVQAKGTEADPAVQAAEKNVADAHANTSQAIAAEITAYGKLMEAEKPALDFTQQVADLREQISKDREAIAQAYDDQTGKALALQDAESKLAASLQDDATALAAINQQVAALKAQGLSVGDIEALIGTAGAPSSSSAPASPASTPTSSGSGGSSDAGKIIGTIISPLVPIVAPLVGLLSVPGRTSSPGPVVIQNFAGYDPTTIARESAREASWSLRTTVAPHLPPAV